MERSILTLALGLGVFLLADSIVAAQAGLVAHWKLDEGAGDVFIDSAGSNDGFLPAGISIEWGEGPPVQAHAVRFLGDSSFIATEFPGIGGNNARTVTFWFKTTDTSTFFLGWGATRNFEKWHIRLNGDTGVMRTENMSGQNFATTDLLDDQWHHVASVFPEGGTNGVDILHYVDGVLDPSAGGNSVLVDTALGDGSAPWSDGSSPGNYYVHFGGVLGHGLDRWLDGLMADVRIYDEGLDQERIQAIMAGFDLGPGLRVTSNLATIDQPRLQLEIDRVCNETRDVIYTLATDTSAVASPAATGGVTFVTGSLRGAFVGLDINGPGTATLSTTNDSGCADFTTQITVFPIQSAEVRIVTAGMEVGDTQPSRVIGSYSDAGLRDITDPSTGTSYSSSDTNVATVDGNGVITAVGEGSTQITATNDGVSDAVTVNVATQLTAIALIVGDLDFNEGDQGVLDLLTSLTFSGDPGQFDAGGLPPKVIPMDDDTFDTALIDATFDLVMISSTVDPAKIGGSFRCVSIPMVFWEEGLNRIDNEALSADGGTSVRAGGQDDLKEFSDLFILNPNHEIMQGVSTDADGFANVFDSPQDISWAGAGPNARVAELSGVLAPGAESLAEYDFLDEATLVVAEAGTQRLGSSSAFLGRRVFLWLSDKSADNLNEVGRGIVARAVNWALGGQRMPLMFATLTIAGPPEIEAG